MAQTHRNILADDQIDDSLALINNFFNALKSSFSGADFPSTNLIEGQPFYHLGQEKFYICKDAAQQTWVLIGDLGKTHLSKEQADTDYIGTGDTLNGANIDAGTVQGAALTSSAVTEGKIGSGAVTEGKIGTGAVTSGKLGANAVTQTKINDGAVIEGKLASDAVSGDKIKTTLTLKNGQKIVAIPATLTSAATITLPRGDISGILTTAENVQLNAPTGVDGEYTCFVGLIKNDGGHTITLGTGFNNDLEANLAGSRVKIVAETWGVGEATCEAKVLKA